MSKTGAGTATPIVTTHIGTLGTTGDAAINTFTFGAGTASADTATFMVWGLFRTVGAGTSAVMEGMVQLTKSNASATAGFIPTVSQSITNTSSGFNSTTANLIIGVSVNGGTGAVWTTQFVSAYTYNW
jgi:hypothetical protein